VGSATGPITGIPWERADGDPRPTEDHNILARYIEQHMARVLLNLLCEDGFINRSPDVPMVDESTGWIKVPPSGDPIVGIIYGRCFYLGADRELSGTASGGDTTYMTSNDFTEVNDFWDDAWVYFTSGANTGTAIQVTDYDLSQKRVDFDGVLGNAVQAGDDFVITFFYVQNLTAGTENWIFARPTGRTTREGLVQWVANTTGSKVSGDILAAKVTLDGGGTVVAVDEAPTGHDRNLWTGMGAVHQISFSGSVAGLAPGAYTDLEIEHDDLILLGPFTDLTVDPSTCTVTPTEYCYGDRFTLRVENTGPYVVTASYSGKRWGRKKVSL